jgi:transposase InsO family protein
LIAILSALWVATGYLCAVRLKAAIPLWLPWIREHFRISAETESGLLRMSARQMDRRLQSRKRKTRRAIYGRTKPGTLLKHQIPIKTDHWDVSNPGYSEIDLVSHSGHSAAGEFAYSLNLTDIFTAWVETRAVLGKSERVVVSALEQMRQSLPYTLRGIDSDNGSEFINEHLLGYCRSNGIQFTRGRPYKKDDNAHIEQKNWTHVRKLFGWRRYDTSEIVRLMNDLYENDLRCFMNMFMPSMKLKKKIRVGSRIRKIYDAPKTPLDRLLESGAADPDRMAALVKLRNTLNPFELSRSIETKIERIQKLVEKRSNSNRIVKQNKPGRQDNSDLFTKRFTKPGDQ